MGQRGSMSNPKEFKLGVSFAILVSFLFVGSCATSPRFTPEEARQARKSLRSVGGKKALLLFHRDPSPSGLKLGDLRVVLDERIYRWADSQALRRLLEPLCLELGPQSKVLFFSESRELLEKLAVLNSKSLVELSEREERILDRFECRVSGDG